MNEKDKRKKKNQASVMGVFKKRGVVKKVHCRLSRKKRHAMEYVQKILFLAHSEDVSLFGKMIAEEVFFYTENRPEVVIGPGANGAMIAMKVAGRLTEISSREVTNMYGDKIDRGFDIRKDFRDLIRNKKVFVVDDVLTSGGSIKDLIEAVQLADGIVIGLAVICNRGGVKRINGISVFALAEMRIPDYPGNDKECPGCKAGIPLDPDIGHPPTK